MKESAHSVARVNGIASFPVEQGLSPSVLSILRR